MRTKPDISALAKCNTISGLVDAGFLRSNGAGYECALAGVVLTVRCVSQITEWVISRDGRELCRTDAEDEVLAELIELMDRAASGR